jgi:hypothetical protein
MLWSEIREVLSQLRTVCSIEPISIETHARPPARRLAALSFVALSCAALRPDRPGLKLGTSQ